MNILIGLFAGIMLGFVVPIAFAKLLTTITHK